MAEINKDQAIAQTRTPPHRGSFGVCAPSTVAGDQRALVTMPYSTLAFLLTYSAGVLTGTRGNNLVATDAAYAVGTAGIGDKGHDLGNADTLTRHETSFFSEGYPFRDYDFLLRGIGIFPEGLPVRVASALDSTKTSASLGGDARTSGTATAAIIQPMASTLVDSIVSLFFQTMSIQLGFKAESARWDMATALFHPAGLGLDNAGTPTNGVPVAARMLKLPFDVQLPRSSTRHSSNAQLLFRQETAQVISTGVGVFTNDGTAVLSGSGTDYAYLAQQVKVVLFGERVCGNVQDDLAAIMQQLGCDANVAQRVLDMKQNGG
jgi:hypothetical protein